MNSHKEYIGKKASSVTRFWFWLESAGGTCDITRRPIESHMTVISGAWRHSDANAKQLPWLLKTCNSCKICKVLVIFLSLTVWPHWKFFLVYFLLQTLSFSVFLMGNKKRRLSLKKDMFLRSKSNLIKLSHTRENIYFPQIHKVSTIKCTHIIVKPVLMITQNTKRHLHMIAQEFIKQQYSGI